MVGDRAVPVVLRPDRSPAIAASLVVHAFVAAHPDLSATKRCFRPWPPRPHARSACLASGRGVPLHRAVEGRGDPVALCRELALVRQERRAELDEADLRAERAAGLALGLPAYVGGLAAARAGGDQVPVEALDRLGVLPPRIGLRLTGWALAVALDVLEVVGPQTDAASRRRRRAGKRRFSEGWRLAVAARDATNLDVLLEFHVDFDGGCRDDGALESALLRCGYARLLGGARLALEESERARRRLWDEVLSGPGTLLVFEITELGPPTVRGEHPPEAIHPRLRVYPEGAEFRYRDGSSISVRRSALAEDLQSGLLQVRVAGHPHFRGDGFEDPARTDLAFSHGLRLNVAGLTVSATRGSVSPIDGGYFIRLVR